MEGIPPKELIRTVLEGVVAGGKMDSGISKIFPAIKELRKSDAAMADSLELDARKLIALMDRPVEAKALAKDMLQKVEQATDHGP